MKYALQKCHFQKLNDEGEGERGDVYYVSNSFNIERTIPLSCYFWETCFYVVNLTVNVVVLS